MSGIPPGDARGLSTEEARRQLLRDGPNRLFEPKRHSLGWTFFEEVREPMILLLLATGVLYSVWGKPSDAVTIIAVIITLVGVEVVNERRAERAIEALHELSEPTAAVIRDGRPAEVPSEELVIGDVLLLRVGRRVAADARILEVHSLAVDESALTGESVPLEKEPNFELPLNTPDADRMDIVFAGTTIVRGRGTAVVVTTATHTAVGEIARLAAEAKPPRTPLQLAMRDLSKYLVGVALAFSVLVPLLGFALASQPLRQMVLIGLSLAFATIPEEMPIIITMVLALGGYRLSRRRAIVKRLQSVESLGAVTVIATDKTGTLTENEMRVVRLEPRDFGRRILEIAVLANDAPGADAPSADPIDAALLRAAMDFGLDVASARATHRLREEFFLDDERKLMSVVCERSGGVDVAADTDPQGGLRVAAKGAPETVLARCTGRWTARGERPLTDEAERAILETAAGMAGDGLRILAFAEKLIDGPGPATHEEAERDLVFTGLVGLADPPRPEAREAIAECLTAGIRTIMVTGDHPLTARAIAEQVGLDSETGLLTGAEIDALSDEELGRAVGRVSIYARTTPVHKLRIVRALQNARQIVAVTGDGINDAPALAAADIGVAMGETGTDVAREAADIVVTDDDFATIVRAIEEGRTLFANLRKGVRYYLACKVALVSVMLLPVLLGVPVPFAPVQIIVMELLMDLAAAATFVVEPPESDLMRRPPRDPARPFMDREMVVSILTSAAGLFAAVSFAYLMTWYAGGGAATSRTVAFATWLLGHFLLAMNLRSEREPLFRRGILSNRAMLAWGAATVVLASVAALIPSVHAVLKTASLSGAQWALAVGAAVAGTFWMEVRRSIAFERS